MSRAAHPVLRALTTAGLVVLMASAATAARPGPAAAQPATTDQSVPGGFRSWSELMRTQERLNAAGERILHAQTRLGAASGYAGIVASAPARRLRLYWKGTLPASIAALVTTVRRDVPVEVLPARHSERELQREVAGIISRPGVTDVAPDTDGSGLTVTVSGAVTTADSFGVAVPVTVQRGTAPIPLAGKQDDASPYYGGGLWKIGTGECSTGFGIRHGGRTKVLSAGHCGANGQAAVDGGGDAMGPVANDSNARDTLMINAFATGSIYIGPYDGIESRRVTGSSTSFPGNLLCRSSALSDESCRILVTAINKTVNMPNPIFPLVQAEQLEHANAAGQGDSGGPVFSYNSAGTVTAYGTVTGGDVGSASAPCTGVTGNRQCSWRIFYADITKTLAFYGATLITS